MEIPLLAAFVQGLQNLYDPYVILAMLAGVGIGTFTAVTPQGLGLPLAYALLLPVVIRWNPIHGIALLIGASTVSSVAAAYLPILFGIPGGAGSQATVLDGYPMGRRGEARRALGASFMAGGMGAIIGTLVLTIAVPVAVPLIYLLRSPELCVVVLWGLSMVSVLAGREPIKGLIAAAFGLLISNVGQQPQSGIIRYAFDQIYLLDGFPISIMALALFGIPSALDLARSKVGVEQQPAPLHGSLLDGVKDALREWWLVVRCSFVGVWVGIVPGLGAQTVDWLSYGHAAQTCKNARETFGKGDVRGVIAPESANDAKDGGDLITTLLLGIPQSVVTALFIMALISWGFVPGPLMLRDHADVVFSIIWIMGMAALVGVSIAFVLANPLGKLAEVRYSYMVPIILTFVLLGAFSRNQSPEDLLAVVLCGVLGYLMKRLGYPRPALILGMVLGGLFEKYFYISMAAYDFQWLLRPSVIGLLILALTSLVYTLWGRQRASRTVARKLDIRLRAKSFFTLMFLLLFLTAIIVGWEWPLVARAMPLYIVSIPGALLCLAQLFRDLTVLEVWQGNGQGNQADEFFVEGLDPRTDTRRTLAFFGWFVGGAVGILALGIVVALPLFMLLYTFTTEGREKWRICVLMSAGSFALIWGLFEYILGTRWPPGAFFD